MWSLGLRVSAMKLGEGRTVRRGGYMIVRGREVWRQGWGQENWTSHVAGVCENKLPLLERTSGERKPLGRGLSYLTRTCEEETYG